MVKSRERGRMGGKLSGFVGWCPCILKGRVVDECCSLHSLVLSYVFVRPQPAMLAPDKAKLTVCVLLPSCECLLERIGWPCFSPMSV